jgi:hypothetical protein
VPTNEGVDMNEHLPCVISSVGLAATHISLSLSMNPASSNISQSQENLRAFFLVAASESNLLPFDHFFV